MKLELSLLSAYRKELMGISAIMILICHAPGNGICMPHYLSYALVQGQIGVDIFLFLSGMGLWYSLSKFGKLTMGGVRKWYYQRIVRIMVPYIIIQGILAWYECAINNLGIIHWISVISTIEFWKSHGAPWFIAMLIPLYLLTPFLYTLFKKNSSLSGTLAILFCFAIALLPDSVTGAITNQFFYNVQFVLLRVPSFILGLLLAPKIKSNANIKISHIVLLLIGAVGMFLTFKHPVDAYMCLIIPIMIVLTNVFDKFKGSLFYKICFFYGDLSLESYLWNQLRPIVTLLLTILSIKDYNNIVMYSLVIVLGTVLSVITSKITKPIIHKITIK